MIDLRTTTKQWLNVVEVMDLLDVSRSTVYYWVDHRMIESLVVGGTVRVSVSDLRKRLRTVDPSAPVPFVFRSVRKSQSISHSA